MIGARHKRETGHEGEGTLRRSPALTDPRLLARSSTAPDQARTTDAVVRQITKVSRRIHCRRYRE